MNDYQSEPERLIVMQTEDGQVSLERADRSTLILPVSAFPFPDLHKEGNVITAIVHNENSVEFINVEQSFIDSSQCHRRHRKGRSQRLRERARRATNMKNTP